MGLMFDTPRYELHANNGPLLRRVAIVMMVFSLIGVCLRFFSRRLVRQPFLWDDWIIVIALPFSWAICVVEILGVKDVFLGQHVQAVVESSGFEASEIRFFKSLYVMQLLYPFSIALTKFSIMSTYRRMFHVKQTKVPLLMLEGMVGAWLTAMAFLAAFSCLPVSGFWNRTSEKSKCINTSLYFTTGAAMNLVTSFLILFFPMPIIWKLQIFRAQKFSVMGMFLLGGFIVFVSCLHLISIIQTEGNPDFTWAFLPLGIWTTIETNVAIFCACIPCMRPLIRALLGQPIYTGAVEKFRGRVPKRRWPTAMTQPSGNNNADFLWLDDSQIDNLGHGTTTVISTTKIELREPDEPVMRDGIHVERTIIWN